MPWLWLPTFLTTAGFPVPSEEAGSAPRGRVLSGNTHCCLWGHGLTLPERDQAANRVSESAVLISFVQGTCKGSARCEAHHDGQFLGDLSLRVSSEQSQELPTSMSQGLGP